MSDKEIICVVGSGMAGITSAFTLHNKGYKVVVFEAKDHIGGRTWTNPEAGVDWGAGWIHGNGKDDLINPIFSLSKKFNIPTLYVGGDSSYVGGKDIIQFYKGKLLSEEEKNKGFEKMEILHEDLNELIQKRASKKNEKDISVEDAIQIIQKTKNYLPTELEKSLLNWHLSVIFGGDFATETSEASLNWFDSNYIDYVGGDYVFPGGIQEIILKMSENLDVRRNHVVTEIDFRNDKIIIVTNQGKFEATSVILTVPFGTLKEKKINFIPSLPSKKLQSINSLAIGTLNKVILVFKECFWPKDQYTFGYISDDIGDFPMVINMMKQMNGVPMLLLMVGANEGKKLEKMTDEEVSKAAMIAIRSMFGDKSTDPIKVFVTVVFFFYRF